MDQVRGLEKGRSQGRLMFLASATRKMEVFIAVGNSEGGADLGK